MYTSDIYQHGVRISGCKLTDTPQCNWNNMNKMHLIVNDTDLFHRHQHQQQHQLTNSAKDKWLPKNISCPEHCTLHIAHCTDNKSENLTCGWVARTPESNSLLSRSCRTYLENWRKRHRSSLVSCQFFEHHHYRCDNQRFEKRGSHHCSVGIQPKRLGLDEVGKIGHLRTNIMRMTRLWWWGLMWWARQLWWLLLRIRWSPVVGLTQAPTFRELYRCLPEKRSDR